MKESFALMVLKVKFSSKLIKAELTKEVLTSETPSKETITSSPALKVSSTRVKIFNPEALSENCLQHL